MPEFRFGADLAGKHFALWGLAFKANTGDMRKATSLEVIQDLFDTLKAALKNPVIFDGRNLYDPALVRGMGFEYLAIGR